MSKTCDRCGTMADCISSSNGLLWLCANCPLSPLCSEFHHEYRASTKEGYLVCFLCGSVMISQDIKKAVVPVATQPMQDFDC